VVCVSLPEGSHLCQPSSSPDRCRECPSRRPPPVREGREASSQAECLPEPASHGDEGAGKRPRVTEGEWWGKRGPFCRCALPPQ